MATTTATTSLIEDIKKDVQELANIATADDVSEEKIMTIRQKAKLNRGLQLVEEYLKYESMVSYITGLRNTIPNRFAEKITSTVSKYNKEELELIFHCLFLILKNKRSQVLENEFSEVFRLYET